MSAPRLLMLTSNAPRWPGDSTTPFVLTLASDLQQLGWRVDVLAPHAPGARNEETIGDVRIRRFHYNVPARAQTLAYGGGALINAQTSLRAAAQVPLFVAAASVALRRTLRHHAHDVVQSHWLLPQGAVASQVAPGAGVPHLATIHGSDVLGLGSPLMGSFKRRALARSTAVSVNSGATEAAVRALAPDHPAVHRLPMGITLPAVPDGANRSALRARWRHDGGPLIAYVGRLVGWKGVDDLLSAMSLLRREAPAVSCVIAGTGQEEARLRRRAVSEGLADSVHFLGWVDPAGVPAILDAADVIVCPSRREADGTTEGQGLSVLEGMASGTPVVASRVGGIPDSLRHDRDGLLVADRDPQAIASAVLTLHRDPQLRSALGASGKERARAFSRTVCTGRFDRLLRELAEEGGSGPDRRRSSGR